MPTSCEEANLRAANAVVVNEHHRQPLAWAQGGGTLSSSDGLRLPMRGKSLTARALSRYFTDQAVTTYCHVSDQHSTFGTRVIVSTERDGLYVLDEILGNTTELPIVEHTTDTHGQMLATFALFDFVGKKLSPRIAKITDKPRWRPHPASHYERWPLAGPLLSQHVQIDLIAEHWDDLRRIAGSLILGYVSASLLVTRLQAGSRQHPLAKALLEYGKLMRTLHALTGSPTRSSAGASDASSTWARTSTTCVVSSPTPMPARRSTATTRTRACRRTA
jgi:TnpA family transposase